MLIDDPQRRSELWTSRVWPGALLVDGEIIGTWRRSQTEVGVAARQPLSKKTREAIDCASQLLPLAGDSITVEYLD